MIWTSFEECLLEETRVTKVISLAHISRPQIFHPSNGLSRAAKAISTVKLVVIKAKVLLVRMLST